MTWKSGSRTWSCDVQTVHGPSRQVVSRQMPLLGSATAHSIAKLDGKSDMPQDKLKFADHMSIGQFSLTIRDSYNAGIKSFLCHNPLLYTCPIATASCWTDPNCITIAYLLLSCIFKLVILLRIASKIRLLFSSKCAVRSRL